MHSRAKKADAKIDLVNQSSSILLPLVSLDRLMNGGVVNIGDVTCANRICPRDAI
jgi:hypothetical protein